MKRKLIVLALATSLLSPVVSARDSLDQLFIGVTIGNVEVRHSQEIHYESLPRDHHTYLSIGSTRGVGNFTVYEYDRYRRSYLDRHDHYRSHPEQRQRHRRSYTERHDHHDHHD